MRTTRALWHAGLSALLLALGLIAAAAPEAAVAAERLAGSGWQRPGAPQYHLSFGGDGRVAGRSGCNRFAGTYRARRGRLDIGRLMSTRMACAPAVMRGERRFLGALRSSRFYRLSASGLVLAGASGAPLLRLVPDRRR